MRVFLAVFPAVAQMRNVFTVYIDLFYKICGWVLLSVQYEKHETVGNDSYCSISQQHIYSNISQKI